MGAIEREFEPLLGQLPKEYGEFEPTVLENLMRVFDSETLRTAGGDVFGRIYEYFLMKFAMQGAQDNHRGDLRPRKALEPWYSVLWNQRCLCEALTEKQLTELLQRGDFMEVKSE